MADSKRTPSDIPRRIEHLQDGSKIIHVEPGALVFCDDCGEDFTDRDDPGGLMFQSKAVCPKCAPKWEKSAREFGEERFIRARCPKGRSFADWVRRDLRSSPAPSEGEHQGREGRG